MADVVGADKGDIEQLYSVMSFSLPPSKKNSESRRVDEALPLLRAR